MKFVSPVQGAKIAIGTDGKLPTVIFKTDGSGGHQWRWKIAWGNFTQSGVVNTLSNTWEATAALKDTGGLLTVISTSNGNSSQVSVTIVGQNSSEAQVKTYLSQKSNSDGFFDILVHESKCKHFNEKGEPIKSFDNGYGVCQLTNPAPNFAQVWSWQQNIDAGLKLFSEKRIAARKYLSQSSRSYSNDQLKRETVSRWNGGKYHEWNALWSRWERSSKILCDVKTGNIGWDMTDSRNVGKTAAQLRERDAAGYSMRNEGDPWRYFGVCYADRVLGAPPPPPAPPSQPSSQPFSPFGKPVTRLA